MSVAEEMMREAEAAVAEMRRACLAARRAHARAELLRHMMLTAAKFDGPADAAAAKIAGEWMAAWKLSAGYGDLGPAADAFTRACLEAHRAPGPAADEALRAALARLDAALAAAGVTLEDEMAWRSECAHGWWALVAPPPEGRGRTDLAPIQPAPGAPFWTAGAPPHCGAAPI